MNSFFELIENDRFRNIVQNRLSMNAGSSSYCFSYDVFPKLYKYRRLSKYSVNDFTQDKITLSAVGSLNDVFEGSVSLFGDVNEIRAEAEKDWLSLNSLTPIKNAPKNSAFHHDSYVKRKENYYNNIAKMKFREGDCLGIHVGCLSERNDSVLMWSHYAGENTGVCIGYDFNDLEKNSLLRYLIFPVSYSTSPVIVEGQVRSETESYNIVTSLLCASLNKAEDWKYEKEWRIVFMMDDDHTHVPIKIIKPFEISFGYHFIKPLFYNNSLSENDRKKDETKKTNLELIMELLNYAVDNDIRTNIMVPELGTFYLCPRLADPYELKRFILKYFGDGNCPPVRLYYVIHDLLLDLIEG